MESHDRIAAIARLGFTERQARFLVLVMQYSGVCLLRQYTAFAGIVHGQKTRKFFANLVSRRFATAYACRHNRGRVYHVHHKALYRAIADTDCRHRRPLSPDQIIQGLATLDAVLATPTIEYLATADERARRLSIVAHLFRDKHPVGIDPDGRVVVLYVATEACSPRFVAFLQRQQALTPQRAGLDAADRRPVVANRPRQDLYQRGGKAALTGAVAETRRFPTHVLRATPWRFNRGRPPTLGRVRSGPTCLRWRAVRGVLPSLVDRRRCRVGRRRVPCAPTDAQRR